MKIVCFPQFYYLSEASRLVEIGKALRERKQDVVFFSHGGPYESVARDAGFEVVSVPPQMSPQRAEEFKQFNRAERGNPFRDSFFTCDELKEYVRHEVEASKKARADAVLIGWNLPSYITVQLVGVPIIVQQPGAFTAPFFDRKMGVFVPSFIGWLRHLPMNWFINWFLPRTQLWLRPFNLLAKEFNLPEYKSLLDLMAGDLTLVMDAPEILGITPQELENYVPAHPEFFRRPPVYRYGGPCFAKLPGEVHEKIREHFQTSRTKLYVGMGVSGSPKVLRDVIEIVEKLDFQTLIATTTILPEEVGAASDQVMLVPHVPAHRVNPLADIALTHGGAGTVQTAIHSGTPLVGVPMHIEQAGNISLVERQGAGMMLPKLDLSPRKLAGCLEKVAGDPSYHTHMQRLKQLQDRIDGPNQAANQIIKFLDKKN